MKDYLVYHNPDSMGWSARELTNLAIVTNKPTKGVQGNRVWLITGEERPRKYFLCAWFIAEHVRPNPTGDFGMQVSGTNGQIFKPMPIDKEEWFADFRRSQGNFAFGLQPINDQRFVKGLEAITVV